MVKPARIAHVRSTNQDGLIRSVLFLSAALCAVGIVLMLMHPWLPLLQILVPVLAVGWVWQRYRRVQQRQQKHLHTVFYRLLQAHDGRMMLLDFAMTAAIPAVAARHYLDHRAKEFAARFEVTEQGDMVYVFSSLLLARSSPAAMPTVESVVNHNVKKPTQPERLMLSACLTQAELANRLGVVAKTISRKKRLPSFIDWTQTRDPDGVGWSYTAETQRFFPVSDRLPEQPEPEDGD